MAESDGDLDVLLSALARVRGRRPGHDGGPRGARRGGPEHLHGRGHGPRSPRHDHAPLGGAPARMRALEALAAAAHPLSVSELADAVGVDQPRASRLVQQAVEAGLAAREADPDDARRTRVALTDAGRRHVQTFRGERRERLARALADFSAEERAQLVRLLSKLAQAWPED